MKKEIDYKELNLDEVKKDLQKTSYGELINKFNSLGLDLKRGKHSSKADLIKQALEALEKLKMDLEDTVEGVDSETGYIDTVRPIKTEKRFGKSQNTPEPKPNDLTASTYNQLNKTIPEKPDLKTDSVKPISRSTVSARSTDPSAKVMEEIKPEDKNEISKKPEIKKQNDLTVESVVENKQLTRPKYSKEVLEKNLASIEANLKNNIPSQRLILLQKQKELTEMLAFYK